MNHKWSLLGVGMFYTAEEALTLLRNMSDFEDESTSESEIEGDSSDSSEYAPDQQYQVSTDSNIETLLPKGTVNQNATKHALLSDETATTSGEEHVALPPKVSKAKEIPEKGQMLHQNWLLIRMPQNVHSWLMKQPPHQVRNMLLQPQKYLKPKKYPQMAKRWHQNQLLKKGQYPKRHKHCVMKEPWHPIVIWMEKTIILLKMTMRVLLLNMSLA